MFFQCKNRKEANKLAGISGGNVTGRCGLIFEVREIYSMQNKVPLQNLQYDFGVNRICVLPVDLISYSLNS